MNDLISNNLDQIQTLCEAHQVESLHAFGSVCTERFDKSSDVDLLVCFQPMDYGDYPDTYSNLAEALEQLLGRSVELTTDKSLSNPYFIESINETKVLLYEQRDQKVSV